MDSRSTVALAHTPIERQEQLYGPIQCEMKPGWQVGPIASWPGADGRTAKLVPRVR
jgi:hypothetical protein